jgi:hypothetical protein
MEAMEMQTGPIPVSVELVCEPLLQAIVLMVSTDRRAELPIKTSGRTIAWTDGDGVAQKIITGRPGDEIEVMIDTSEKPRLRPAAPSRRFRIPMRPEILVFEQAFKEEKPKPKQRRKKRTQKARVGPLRI